jgi:hypothetical protein
MDFIPLNGNCPIDTLCIDMENMVGEHLMRTEPLTEVDLIILLGLFSIVIWCFKYIRNHK